MLALAAVEAARPVVRNARENAEPVVRRGASSASGKLSGAAGRASAALAETADWLEDTAKTQKALSKKAGKRRFRKVKGLVAIGAVFGAVVALVKSPFGEKVRDKLTGGPYPDELDEPEGITLSVDRAGEPAAGRPKKDESGPTAGVEGNGVGASKAKERIDT
jgi:hypothetical protein